MDAVRDATLNLLAGGEAIGTLHIACLANDLDWREGIPYLASVVGEEAGDGADIQLLEESEYTYRIEGLGGAPVVLEPTEIFSWDDEAHRSGRIKTGRFVGTVKVSARNPGQQESSTTAFEVRSRKLDYLTDFQWMLSRIASEATDLLLAHFAPAAVSLKPDGEAPATSLYSRFALLSAILGKNEIESAIQLILHRPHSQYRATTESVRPSRGLRSGRELAKSLAGPGPRQEIRSGIAPRGLTTLPEQVDQTRHIESIDTVPNRFVKYALTRWRDIASDVAQRLATRKDAASHRGRQEADALADWLDELLGAVVFSDVGDLERFPAGNQVLQRREGYRELFRAFFEIEAAASIDWGETGDVFPAGSKDVATLYEYWAYLELARIIRQMPTFHVDQSTLIEESDGGLTLRLRHGTESVVRGSGMVNGRRIDLELFYNKKFVRSKTETGAWTRQVRPDCSLHIRSADSLGNRDDVWLHFDAKYRVNDVYEAFGKDNADGAAEVERSYALTDDLLKMHTYRDAIKRSVGSFVLYPGKVPDPEKSRFQRYHEILPGIGAFALRPTAAGTTTIDSESELQQFVSDVIHHLSRRGTGFERADYWTQRTYSQRDRRVPPTTLLETPPVDTLVLIGFVKSSDHWAWIEQSGLYNLRADDRPGAIDLSSKHLDARFVLLHGREGTSPRLFTLRDELVVRTAEELVGSGYAQPGGDRYVCVHIDEEVAEDTVSSLTNEQVVTIKEAIDPGGEPGSPLAATWTQIFGIRSQS